MDFIEKIKGLFKKFKFDGTATLADGKSLRISGGEMIEGAQVFLETKEGELPLPDGVWELQENFTIVTKDGMIVSAEQTPELTEPEPLVEMAEEVLPQVTEEATEQVVETETIVMEEAQPVAEIVETPTQPDRVDVIEGKLDQLLAKLEGMFSSFETITTKFEEHKQEIETKFEKVSAAPSLKKMDKEVPTRASNSILGSYDDLLKNK